MTDLRQAAQQVLDAWDDPMGMKNLCVVMDALRTALEQQVEPVACIIDGDLYFHHEIDWEDLAYQGHEVKLLYTTPPQRQWVGLTDEDFLEACQIAERGNYLLALQRIQIKLKERNHDR